MHGDIEIVRIDATNLSTRESAVLYDRGKVGPVVSIARVGEIVEVGVRVFNETEEDRHVLVHFFGQNGKDFYTRSYDIEASGQRTIHVKFRMVPAMSFGLWLEHESRRSDAYITRTPLLRVQAK